MREGKGCTGTRRTKESTTFNNVISLFVLSQCFSLLSTLTKQMIAKQHLTSFLDPHKEIYSGGGNESNSAKHHVSNKYILFDAP